MSADALIVISIVISVVIYVTYYLFVRKFCRCEEERTEADRQSIEHVCCGRCYEKPESRKTLS
ncbi:hypothetical protein [Seleniivibrio woodruffii]|uniref:Uncharacterized protein n=1 Tax=Seleniivibrio woodruffii TaxID=1078050 RepID=A0A4R1KCP4_9BACT|nr:hypothetical protein [Seleniivibrio woodruffii]TCK62378.1 hypothetical protein C8D98_0904 [Seleniivibrio woodruffii]TVZ34504.1 hypothetical protein OF66_0089 [Seleniivibrio woodruffii]